MKRIEGKTLKCTCGSKNVKHQYGQSDPMRSHWNQNMYYIECLDCGRNSSGYIDVVAGKDWMVIEEEQ